MLDVNILKHTDKSFNASSYKHQTLYLHIPHVGGMKRGVWFFLCGGGGMLSYLSFLQHLICLALHAAAHICRMFSQSLENNIIITSIHVK